MDAELTSPSGRTRKAPQGRKPDGSARGEVTGILVRFVTCGLLSLACGAAWRVTRAPSQVGVASAMGDILVLLVGFIAGGLAWYLRDVRRRSRQPERVTDERLAFSFIVFVAVPLAVLITIGLVWAIALAIGAR